MAEGMIDFKVKKVNQETSTKQPYQHVQELAECFLKQKDMQ